MKESHEDTKARSNLEELSANAVDCAYKLHVEAGPESLNRTLYLWERARVRVRSIKIPLGLLINFVSPTFKEGCQHIVNGSQSFVASRLRVNQIGGAP